MSQFDGGRQSGSGRPASNIYTVLCFIAVAAMTAGVGVMWANNVELTGEFQDPNKQFKNPFYIVDPEQLKDYTAPAN